MLALQPGTFRSSATKIRGFEGIRNEKKPYVEKPLSEEAKKKLTAIVKEDRWKQRQDSRQNRIEYLGGGALED